LREGRRKCDFFVRGIGDEPLEGTTRDLSRGKYRAAVLARDALNRTLERLDTNQLEELSVGIACSS